LAAEGFATDEGLQRQLAYRPEDRDVEQQGVVREGEAVGAGVQTGPDADAINQKARCFTFDEGYAGFATGKRTRWRALGAAAGAKKGYEAEGQDRFHGSKGTLKHKNKPLAKV
jgi:hypothetical protein